MDKSEYRPEYLVDDNGIPIRITKDCLTKDVLTRKLKLTIESVPKPCYGRNLHKLMSRKDWDTLRRQVYHKYNYQCAICGASGRMTAHEVWEYDDDNHTQKLVDIIAICNMCDHCKHMGLSQILASESKLNLREVQQHFIRINGIYEPFLRWYLMVGLSGEPFKASLKFATASS